MDTKLKERLVGAVVLISLAVIFLPELLRPPSERPAATIDLRMPPVPEIRTLPTPPEPVQLPVDPPMKLPDQSASEDVVTNEPTDRSAVTEHDEPAVPADLRGWVIQVGAFANRANARRLRDELRELGYAAYMDELDGQTRTLHRVRVGPELEKSRAEAALAEIRDRFDLEPRLGRYP